MNNLFSILNLRSGEGKLVTLMLIYAFFIGLGNVFSETVASALFLADHGAAYLPFIYIATAIVTPVSSYLYLKFEQKLTFARLVRLNMVFLAIALLLFWCSLLVYRRLFTPALIVWAEVSWDLAELGVWNLAGRLFNVRQSKRLFSLIGAGLIVSEAFSGFSTPLLVRWLGTPNLLLVAVVAFVGALGIQSLLARTYPAQLSSAVEEDDEDEPQVTLRSILSLFKIRYIMLIFAIIFVYSFSHDFLSNAFYFEVERQYVDEAQIAGFIGIFSGLTGLVGALMGALASGRLINRYGLRFGLLALPVALLLCAVVIVATGTLAFGSLFFFGMVALARFLDSTLEDSTNSAAIQILYQPLPAKQRVRVQGAVNMIKPITGGLVGVVLLILNVQLGFETLQLTQVLLIILILWIVLAWLVSKQFPQMLMQALSKRHVVELGTGTLDGTTLDLVRSALSNPRPEVVLYCLNLLQVAAPESVATYLADLLGHPEPAVRHEIIRRVESLGSTSFIPSLQKGLEEEANQELKGAYLRALATLGDPQILERWEIYLQSPTPAIKLGLLVGLLRSGEIEGIAIAAQQMLELVNSPVAADRIFATQIISESGISGFYRALLKLLYDDELHVRIAAIEAAGTVGTPQCWLALVELLSLPKLRSKAAAALVKGGQAVVPALKSGFDNYQQSPDVLMRLAQISGRVGGDEALVLLKSQLPVANSEVRTHILAALSKSGYTPSDQERLTVRQGLEQEMAETISSLSSMVNLADTQFRSEAQTDTHADRKAHAALSLLQDALRGNLLQQRERILYWLSFLYDAQMIKQAHAVLLEQHKFADAEEKHAYALEIIDLLIDSELKQRLLPLLDNLTPAQSLQQLGVDDKRARLGGSPSKAVTEIVTGLNTWATPWLRSCALHANMYLSPQTLTPVVSSLDAPSPLVRETATWVLSRIAPDHLRGADDLLRRPDDANDPA